MLAKVAKLKKLLQIDDDHIALAGLLTNRTPDEVDIDFKNNDDLDFKVKQEKKGIKNVNKFQVVKKRDNKFDSVISDNPFLMNIPFALAIIGVVKAGKTTFMRNILDIYYDAFDKVIFISPTMALDPDAIHLLDAYPDISAYPSLLALEPIFNKIKKINKGKDPKDKLKTLIILDDVINQIISLVRKDSSFLNDLMLNRRHAGISMIALSQYFKRFPPLWRTNFSAFALFRQENQGERKKISEELNGHIGVKEFERIFNEATQESYSALTINFDANDGQYIYTKNFNELLF